MIPAEARKELENELEERVDTLKVNYNALLELNASDDDGFLDILNTLDEEAESLINMIENAREVLTEDN